MSNALDDWRQRILITSWITYSTFYLARVNLAIAIPGIAGEFEYSKVLLGGILTAFMVTYAIGQFISGQLGDKFSPRSMVAIGICGSALLNIAFGFSTGIPVMIIIWGMNGFLQSMGWAPTVKTIASWFPAKERGKIGSILGTSYIVGNAYTWAFAGFVGGVLGWRWMFWLPPIPTYLFEVHDVGVSAAALQAAIIPTAGVAGALLAGWLSDRVFTYRRGPIASIMLVLLAVTILLFPYMALELLVLSVAGLIVTGMMIYGPDVLIVGVKPMDIGEEKAAASVSGFINGFGYVGAAITGVFSGFLIDAYSWLVSFYFWAASAATAALLMVVMGRLEISTCKK